MAKIAIVWGQFHTTLVKRMCDEAERVARELNLEIVQRVPVPGSFEKPLAIRRLLERSEIAGVVALGIIERGETKHGLVIGLAVSKAIIDLQLQFNKPVGYGILGPEIFPSQIEPRLLPAAKQAVVAVKAMLQE